MVKRRVNQVIATEAILLQLAVSSMFSREAGKDFSAHVNRLAS